MRELCVALLAPVDRVLLRIWIYGLWEKCPLSFAGVVQGFMHLGALLMV